VGLGVLAVTIGIAGAGVVSAQSPAAAFTDARCLTGDGWGAILSINADNAEHDPVAHVSTDAGPYSVAVPPNGYSTLITALSSQITVVVSLSWSDATTRDLGPVTIDRPGSCAVTAAAATTPPPTTCAQAIPPRGDCNGPAAAPTTAPPRAALATDARLDNRATLLAMQTAASAPGPAAVGHAATLPTTGSFPAAVVAAGAAALLAGLALVWAASARRRSPLAVGEQ
jgi:hypothetical protein